MWQVQDVQVGISRGRKEDFEDDEGRKMLSFHQIELVPVDCSGSCSTVTWSLPKSGDMSSSRDAEAPDMWRFGPHF